MRANYPRPGSSHPSFQRTQCFKTKQCKFWLDGKCTRGNACTYAHADQELRPAPDLKKTKVCSRWKQGTCALAAASCTYAHGLEDLRRASSASSDSDLSGYVPPAPWTGSKPSRKPGPAAEPPSLHACRTPRADCDSSGANDDSPATTVASSEELNRIVKTLSTSELSQGLISGLYEE